MLDAFPLRDNVVAKYKHFTMSFTTIHTPDTRQQVEGIFAGIRYRPEPLIRNNSSYRRSTEVDAVAASGVLNPRCADVSGQNASRHFVLPDRTAPGPGHTDDRVLGANGALERLLSRTER